MYTLTEQQMIADVYTERTTKRVDLSKACGQKYLAKCADAGYTPAEICDLINERGDTLRNVYDALNLKTLAEYTAHAPKERPPYGAPAEELPAKEAEAPEVEAEAEEAPAKEAEAEAKEAEAEAKAEAPEAVNKAIDALKEALQEARSDTEVKNIEYHVNGDKKGTVKAKQHAEFDRIIKMVLSDRDAHKSPYLYGPAGSGKNYTCEQVAKALNLPFYYQNCVQEDYELKGYNDAQGNYQPTLFYNAFKNGGIFMLDEVDASDASALITLNACLANYYFTFANGEQVHANKDFHVIGAGNTIGTGADDTYSGRYQLDGATLNRFFPVKIDYDKKVENSLTNKKDLLAFVRAWRKACERAGVRSVCGYRDITAMDKYTDIFDKVTAVKALTEYHDADDLRMIAEHLPQDNEYTIAVNEIIKGR